MLFFSQEIVLISKKEKLSYMGTIIALKNSSFDSITETAAEVLNDEARNKICPEKINSDKWIKVISLAHSLGIYTTSTMLCGYVENMNQ